MRLQYLPRSSFEVAAQPSNAARAAFTALSTSAALPAGTWPMTSPLVESNTSIDPLPAEGTHAPSM